MNDLIEVNPDRQTTSARNLWKFLDKPYKHFTDWFNQYKGYGFTENVDFMGLSDNSEKPQGGRPTQDYEITIDMAKELCMLQKTDKGSQARKYFIAVQNAWNSPEMIMKRAMQYLNLKVDTLQKQISLDKPKVEFANHVATATNSLLVREAAKIITKDGIKIGEQRLYTKLREWGWVFKKSCEATQYAIETGYMELSETVKETSKGNFTFKTSRVTGKGQLAIVKKLKDEQEGVQNGAQTSN